jgi:hypothetical protein
VLFRSVAIMIVVVVVMVMIVIVLERFAAPHLAGQVRPADRAAGMGDAAFRTTAAMIDVPDGAAEPKAAAGSSTKSLATARGGMQSLTAATGGMDPFTTAGRGMQSTDVCRSKRRGSEQSQGGEPQSVRFRHGILLSDWIGSSGSRPASLCRTTRISGSHDLQL